MSARTITWESWALAEEADRRFRRICAVVAIPLLIFALVIPFIVPPSGLQQNSKSNANLGQEVTLLPAATPKPAPKKEEPKPAEKAKKIEQPKKARPVVRNKPKVNKPKPQESARQKAQAALAASGLGSLASLSDQNLSAISSKAPLTSGAIKSKGGGGERTFAKSAETSASADVNSGSDELTRDTSNGIGNREVRKVHSIIGLSRRNPQLSQHHGAGAFKPGRTQEEIQLVLDRNQGRLYAMYNKVLRVRPDEHGRVLLRFTISPGGKVIAVKILSSPLHDPAFESQILTFAKSLSFEPKSVPTISINVFLDFHPPA